MWSGLTQRLFTNSADFTALSSFTSEASLLAGLNQQPTIPANTFIDDRTKGATLRIRARGVLGSTGTPTYTFQARLNTTVGSANLSGASVGVTAALTTQSGVTNEQWELLLDLICTTPGQASTNGVLSGAGWVMSPGGLASPFTYPLQPTTPDTATWTTGGFDFSVAHYLNLSVTCSASSASNTIRCKQLIVELLG